MLKISFDIVHREKCFQEILYLNIEVHLSIAFINFSEIEKNYTKNESFNSDP